MPTSPKCIINVGFARCGTTAMSEFFKTADGIEIPTDRKELKYFMGKDSYSLSDYLLHFKSEGTLFFESSPPYSGLGLPGFKAFCERVKLIQDQGADVQIVFMLRNLLSRSFSHYWHDIYTHHAVFGGRWKVNKLEDPERLQDPFTDTFPDVMSSASLRQKFRPPVAQIIKTAIEMFGVGRIRIGYTKMLDDAVQHLVDLHDILVTDAVKTPRVPSARAPIYVRTEDEPREVAIETNAGPKTYNVPKSSLLICSKYNVELIKNPAFDVQKVMDAEQTWSRQTTRDELPQVVFEYLERQHRALQSIPEFCFLGACRTPLLEDLAHVPETLSVKQATPGYRRIAKALTL